MVEQSVERQFMCPGCPAEVVMQNIASHRDMDPGENGTLLVGILTRKINGPIAHAIRDGATMTDEVNEHMITYAGSWAPDREPDRMYGDLTKAEITQAVIACFLRSCTGERNLDTARTDLLKQEIEDRRNFLRSPPPPSKRPAWLDRPVKSQY